MRKLGRPLLFIISSAGLGAQAAPLDQILGQLRQGGLVLVMRHASAPRETPTREQSDPGNVNLERQLDQRGRDEAVAMGKAIKAFHIPIGTVLTSPTYRARQTVQLAGLPSPTSVGELGDGGQSMQGVTESQAAWLRNVVTQSPKLGNTIVVTHQPNLARAFPEWGSSVADGEVVIVRPDGRGGISIIARIPISEWPRLER